MGKEFGIKYKKEIKYTMYNLPYVTWNVKDKEYRLRLTTMGCMALEDKLGKNPADIFVALSDGQLPKVREIVLVLHQALQPFNSGCSVEKAAEILDNYFETGKSLYDFMSNEVMKLFQSAGLLGSEANEESAEGALDPNA